MKIKFSIIKTIVILIYCLFNTSLSFAQCFTNTSYYNTGTGPKSIVSADFNSDGKLDLATANSGSNNISILIGNGSGVFSAPTNFTTAITPTSLTNADFNNDGKMDLAVASNNGNQILILLGNGGGGFSSSSSFMTFFFSMVNDILSNDFNNDGKMDLATADDINAAFIYLGDGLGGFNSTTFPLATGTNPISLSCGDFNGDTKKDLVFANSGSNNISVLIGNGTGGFSSPTNHNVGSSPFSVTTADFNGDGKMDLATANNNSYDVSVLLGNGTGGFSSAINYTVTGSQPKSIISADFNGDGILDLATANNTSSNISILTGNGTGSFSSATSIFNLYNPNSILSKDFNSDGKIDLAATNSIGNNVSVFLNNSFTVTVNSNNVTGCYGNSNGSASAFATGGVGPFTFLWNTTPTQTVSNLSGLSAGSYVVQITGGNGCAMTKNFTITQPSQMTLNFNTTSVSCYGGNNGTAGVSVTANGNPPYSYQWSNGSTQSNISNLSASNQTVVVTDVNGCSVSQNITITQPSAITLSSNSTSVSCFGGNNGTASVSVTANGTPPYTYLWSNGQTTQTATNLTGGNKTVVVTDINGCFATQTVTINQAPAMILNISSTNVSCSNGNDGTAGINFINNGTTPFSYLWSNGSSQSNISNLGVGNYTVTVTDANGCNVTQNVSVNQTGNCPAVIAAGGQHTLKMCGNGTLESSGYNFSGELGNGTNGTGTDSNIPVTVSNLNGVTAVAGGNYHSIALKNNGTVWAWGDNGYSQLGNGTFVNSNIPIQVNSLNNVTHIASGVYHSLALKNDGTVWGWGYNYFGQLGDGTNTMSSAAVQATGLNGVSAIAAGYIHSVALKTDGTVWAWGSSAFGQLGLGTFTSVNAPIQVTALSGITSIACGYRLTLALKNDGTVWSFGENGVGQLGIGISGSGTESYAPVQVNGLTSITAIACGWEHCFAMKNDGTVWAWGGNYYGKLGDGTTTDRSTPTQIPSLTGVKVVNGGCGAAHSIGVKPDGSIWAWGGNYYGQLGNGTLTDIYTSEQLNNQWCQSSQIGLKELDEKILLSIYPNPNNGKFTINMENINTQNAIFELEINNVVGQKVYSENISQPKTHLLDLNLPSGLYFVKLKSGNKTNTKKIIIQ